MVWTETEYEQECDRVMGMATTMQPPPSRKSQTQNGGQPDYISKQVARRERERQIKTNAPWVTCPPEVKEMVQKLSAKMTMCPILSEKFKDIPMMPADEDWFRHNSHKIPSFGGRRVY